MVSFVPQVAAIGSRSADYDPRMAEFATINEYIASFPTDVQPALESIRETIHNTVPGLDETISYQMPTMTVKRKEPDSLRRLE